MQHDKAIVESIDSEPESFSWRWRDVDARSMVAVLVLVYVLVLIRTAWVSDDAYITFRTIDNFVNGYGLRWNVAERVQSFTHPLWLFVVTFAYLITGDFYFTSIFLSIAISAAAVLILVYGLARSDKAAILALTVLILSKAFTDYSTSGLENPLTHLLLVVFILVYLRFERSHRSLLLLSLVAALGTLNRMDTLLLYLPTLAYAAFRLRTRKAIVAIAAGFTPFILWEVFSFFYYGFFIPNTAYAKLGAGIPISELMSQGLAYLLNSISVDPLTMLTIAGAVTIAVIRKTKRHFPMLAGALLFMVYTVYIGGDFMSGRFLTGPLLIAAIVISTLKLPKSYAGILAPLAVVLVIGLSSPYCPIHSGTGYGCGDRNSAIVIWQANGMADERGQYYCSTGLMNWTRGLPTPHHPRIELGETWKTGDSGSVVVGWANGFSGFAAGAGIYIIDAWALCDPLLARLPAAENRQWRIGHHERFIPAGYRETRETGQNCIVDSSLAAYYDKLALVTSGKLLSWNRIKTAVLLNLSQYDHLLPESSPPPMSISRQDVSTGVIQGSAWNGEGTTALDPAGAQIDLGEIVTNRKLEIALDHNDDYRLVFVRGATLIDSLIVRAANIRGGGMALHLIDVPARAADTGFDAIRVFPSGGDNRYSVGHLHFGPADTTSNESPLGTSP